MSAKAVNHPHKMTQLGMPNLRHVAGHRFGRNGDVSARRIRL